MTSPLDGLDPAYLTSLLTGHRRRVTSALTAIEAHLSNHNGYVAWSGGKDSTVVVDLAHRAAPGVPVVWFDSGLEFPETHQYISAVAEQLNLNLHILQCTPDALTVLQQTGTWDHNAALAFDAPDLHETLITRPSLEAHALYGNGEITGLRAEESVGRRALLARGDGAYQRADGSNVLAPIWAWNDRDVNAYLVSRDIPENPVYEKLASLGAPERARRVGLVVDGNNPEHGRYTYLRHGWPELWAELVRALPRLNEWR
jgi:phosphoadenosine phosphosulfate reductase